MEAVSIAPPPANTLPSPPMERKSPLSPSSSVRGDKSRTEEVAKFSEDRQSQENASPRSSAAASPKHAHEEQMPSRDDYAKGLVLCGTCGESVPFRDPQSGGFTLRLWDMHRDRCRSRHGPRPEPIVFTPETTVDSMANPPLKKRRAKRTEEERIEYLRSDPYVAQFEPYRVLCGSCNKWIRLRPNSTYCSIPWDAHRKSCLSKKAILPIDHRSPDTSTSGRVGATSTIAVRVGGGARGVSPNGHPDLNGGIHVAHPSSNGPHSSFGQGASSGPGVKSRAQAPSLGSLPPPTPFSRGSVGSPYATPTSMASGSYMSGPDCSPPTGLRDLGSGPGALASHDARRKNAEQRAAALKADPLLREVEPNRVFCSLCGKWVQLRQDSSFCAYPWHQHRSKCLARYQRRQERAHNYALAAQHGNYDVTRYGHHHSPGSSRLAGDPDGDGSFDDEPESEDDHHPLSHRHSLEMDSGDEGSHHYQHVQPHGHAYKRYEKAQNHPYSRPSPPPPSSGYTFSSPRQSTGGRYKSSTQVASIADDYRYGAPSYALRRAVSHDDPDDISMDDDVEGEGDVDVIMEDNGGRRSHGDRYSRDRSSRNYSHARAQNQSRRRDEIAPALADLHSASGRLAFISVSIEYLFNTTYDRGDELSVGGLVNYLNAAMPADKHDDFDVQEVTRAAASLAKTGVLVQEGDRLRPRD